jgi:hypothetical protein
LPLKASKQTNFFLRDLKHKYRKTVGDVILHELGETRNAHRTRFGTFQGKYALMVGLQNEKCQDINHIEIFPVLGYYAVLIDS